MSEPEAESSLDPEERVATEEEEEGTTQNIQQNAEEQPAGEAAEAQRSEEPDTAEEQHSEEQLSEEAPVEETSEKQHSEEQPDEEEQHNEEQTVVESPVEETLAEEQNLEEEPSTDEQHFEEQEADPQESSEEQQEILHELQSEQEALMQLNSQLQEPLAFYFQNMSDDLQSEVNLTGADLEEHYQNITKQLKMNQCEQMFWKQRVSELQQQKQERQEQAEREWTALTSSKLKAVTAAVARTKGREAGRAERERLQEAEQKCREKLMSVRLENIKMSTRINATLQAPSNRCEQRHDQLRMEIQVNAETYEDLKAELQKKRRRFSSPVQFLTHVKEKLQFLQQEIQKKRTRLAEVDATLTQEEEALARVKHARDVLRAKNLHLQQKSGMLGNTTLLRDMEDTEDERQALEPRVEALERRYEGRAQEPETEQQHLTST